MSINYEVSCKRIWKSYKMYSRTAFVIRRGYETIGLSNDGNSSLSATELFRLRGESGLEHQAKTAWLCSVFANNFPDYFGRSYLACEISAFNLWDLMVISLNHDIGEIVVGDILDDGNHLHGIKDEAELKVFSEMIEAYSPTIKQKLLAGFSQFQSKQSIVGKAIYALDKLEAILTQINLAERGLEGSILSFKIPSDADRYYMSIANSDSPIEAWAAQMKANTLEYPSSITKPVYTLFEVAFKELRGELPDWWNFDFAMWEDTI